MKYLGACVAAGAIAGLVFAGGGEKMKISSSAFSEGGSIPSQFTCDGADTSPPLQIDGIPEKARSLVLIVDDPDAPSGLFTHWLVWNIDPKTRSIPAGGTLPGGTDGKNGFGKSGYGGPCPPSGTHRYYFRVYAMNRRLDVPAGAKLNELNAAMKGHVLAQGELMGRYTRKR